MGKPKATIKEETVRIEIPFGPVTPFADVDPAAPFENSNAGVEIGVPGGSVNIGIGADGITAGGQIGIGGKPKGKEALNPIGGGASITPGGVSIGGQVTISPGAVIGVGGPITVAGNVELPGGRGGGVEVSVDGCTITTTFEVMKQKISHVYTNPKCDPSPSPSPSPAPSTGQEGKGNYNDWQNYNWGTGDPNDLFKGAYICPGQYCGEAYIPPLTPAEILAGYERIWTGADGKLNIRATSWRIGKTAPPTNIWNAELYWYVNWLGDGEWLVRSWAWKGTDPYNAWVRDDTTYDNFQTAITKDASYDSWIVKGFAPTPFNIQFSRRDRPTNLGAGCPVAYSMKLWCIPADGSEPYLLNPGSNTPPSSGGGDGSPKYNPPPMPQDKCCEASTSMLRKLYQVLDVDKLLADGFATPNRMMVAKADGVTVSKTYTSMLACFLRVAAHGMIFEPTLDIKDADSSKAGNQELKMEFLNATAWAKAMGEMLYEVMDDGNSSTKVEIGTAITVTQTLLAISDCVRKLDAVLDGLGVQLNQRREIIETAFDLTLGEKGFDSSGKPQPLDKLSDNETEALLPALLVPKRNPLKTVGIHPKADSIVEILQDIKNALQARSAQ